MLDRKKARSAAPVKFHFKSTIAVRATTRKPTRLITSKPTRSTTSRPTIGKLILSRVYMIHNELSASQYTDLPFEVESGSIHSAQNYIFQDFFSTSSSVLLEVTFFLLFLFFLTLHEIFLYSTLITQNFSLSLSLLFP